MLGQEMKALVDLAPYELARPIQLGSWIVIDRNTGGPAEIEVDGEYRILFKLPKADAEAWSKRLTEELRLKIATHPSR